jgi:hypothetical protein
VGLTSQVHDFNPGISSTGLFWTARIERGSVKISLGSGSASLHVAELPVGDYGNVGNALTGGAGVASNVTFDVGWHGVDERVTVRNGDVGFGGEYVRNSADLVWSASEPGFTFHSDPLASDFATLGHERNGVFFS